VRAFCPVSGFAGVLSIKYSLALVWDVLLVLITLEDLLLSGLRSETKSFFKGPFL
jgi:hypothetical protein